MGGGEFLYVKRFLHWFVSCLFVGLACAWRTGTSMLSASLCEYDIINMWLI